MENKKDIYIIASLLVKSIFEKLSDDEKLYLKNNSFDEIDLERIPKELFKNREIEDKKKHYEKYPYKNGYDDFCNRINKKSKRKNNVSYFINSRFCKYAALIVFMVSFYFLFIKYFDTKTEEIIKPGKELAILTINDHERIRIEDKSLSIVNRKEKINYDKGVLSYNNPATQIKNKANIKESADFSDKHELYVPRGGENSVILSDGTIVHMNADSKLTYPVVFEGSKRIVLLEGESFFEVTPDKKRPFIVRTSYGDIEVVGTSFNVNAYKKNNYCKTTLVSGKVNYKTPKEKVISINPNEQVVYSSGVASVKKVNAEDYTSWMKGYYSFHNESLLDIMKSFEEWYDVKVVYKNDSLKSLSYTGRISRKESLNSFLRTFKMTGDIDYSIKNRVITITENQE